MGEFWLCWVADDAIRLRKSRVFKKVEIPTCAGGKIPVLYLLALRA